MEARTHLGLDRSLCGEPEEVGDGFARVGMTTTPCMRADERGLVHGGFVFGQVDHAAMLAVNDPNVVLGSADVRFLAPVAVGQRVVAEARVVEASGRKRRVQVRADVDGAAVLSGELVAFVLDGHVLDGRRG